MSTVDGGLKTASVSITATNNAVIAGTAGQRIYVLSYLLGHSGGATLTSQFTDAGTGLEGAWAAAPATGTRNEHTAPGEYLFATSAGNGLGITVGGTGTVAGRITYRVGF